MLAVCSEDSGPLLFLDALERRQSQSPDAGRAQADRLVASYLYLCRRGARKFWRSGLERSDLEQVAAIGLIKASRRYDASSRTPFEAYAWIIILGELMHHVRDHERAVRVPRRLRALEPSFHRAHDALLGKLGREPSDSELAREMGVLVATIGELRRSRDLALTVAIDEAEGSACPDGSGLTLEDRLLFSQAFAALSVDERRIIVGLYLLGIKQLTLGRGLGLSPKRVSRLHQAAIARMQRTWTP